MKATLRATAGPPPPLPTGEPGRRSRSQLDAEVRWAWWARRAGQTRAEMMATLRCSEASVKRRLRMARQELAWEIGDADREEGLAAEWETRLEVLRSGEIPPPLTQERELALMEFVERAFLELQADFAAAALATIAAPDPATRRRTRSDRIDSPGDATGG